MNQDPIPLKNQKTRSLFADTIKVYIRTYSTASSIFRGLCTIAFIKRRFDPFRGNKINRIIGRKGKSNWGPHNECYTVAKKMVIPFPHFSYSALISGKDWQWPRLESLFYSRGRCVVLFLQITEPEFVKLLRNPRIDSQSVGIDSWAPQTFSNTGSGCKGWPACTTTPILISS